MRGLASWDCPEHRRLGNSQEGGASCRMKAKVSCHGLRRSTLAAEYERSLATDARFQSLDDFSGVPYKRLSSRSYPIPINICKAIGICVTPTNITCCLGMLRYRSRGVRSALRVSKRGIASSLPKTPTSHLHHLDQPTTPTNQHHTNNPLYP